jgi:hypothetical protein
MWVYVKYRTVAYRIILKLDGKESSMLDVINAELKYILYQLNVDKMTQTVIYYLSNETELYLWLSRSQPASWLSWEVVLVWA